MNPDYDASCLVINKHGFLERDYMAATPPQLTPFSSVSFSTGTTCRRHDPKKAQQIKSEKLETALRDETAWMEHWESKVAGIFAEFRAWCDRYDRGEPPPFEPLPRLNDDGFSQARGVIPFGGSGVKSALQVREERQRVLRGQNPPPNGIYPPKPEPSKAPPLPR